MCADGEVMEEMRESHRGMVDGCRCNGGRMGEGSKSSLMTYSPPLKVYSKQR